MSMIAYPLIVEFLKIKLHNADKMISLVTKHLKMQYIVSIHDI